jgi:hypothetical protein
MLLLLPLDFADAFVLMALKYQNGKELEDFPMPSGLIGKI